MRRLALYASLVFVVAIGLWGWRQHLVGRLMLLAPSTRVENFRHMDRLFPSRPVRHGDAVFTFERAPRPLNVVYQYDGATRRLDDFLAATTVLAKRLNGGAEVIQRLASVRGDRVHLR